MKCNNKTKAEKVEKVWGARYLSKNTVIYKLKKSKRVKTYFAQVWVEIPGFSVVIHQFNLCHVNTVVARFENTLKLKMTAESKTV